jgi:hypothetical protein
MLHGVATGIQIPVVIKQVPRVRHEGIRAQRAPEELAEFGVIGSTSSPTVAGFHVD